MEAMATIVLEALELWPFTIDVLKIMGMFRTSGLNPTCPLTIPASVPSFRNAALLQKPMLLETLLTNAIDSRSGFDKVINGDRCMFR